MANSDVPTTEPESIWLYNPNLALSIVFSIIYLFPTVIQAYQSIYKHRSCYFTTVLFGAILEVAGYAVRAASCTQQWSIVRPPLLHATRRKNLTSTPATLRNPIFLRGSRAPLLQRRQLPPHLASLPSRPAFLNHSHLPYSRREAHADFCYLRYFVVPDPGLRHGYSELAELGGHYANDWDGYLDCRAVDAGCDVFALSCNCGEIPSVDEERRRRTGGRGRWVEEGVEGGLYFVWIDCCELSSDEARRDMTNDNRFVQRIV